MRSRGFSAFVLVLGLTTAAVAAPTTGDPVRRSLYVPVRDGTRLAVNIYHKAGAAEPRPTVFVFTPYRARFRDKDGTVRETGLDDRLALRALIDAGYTVAVADIRGKGASFGHRRGFQDRTEAQDGHDLVEWLAAQPFSTGKVGMMGCSYLGGTVFHTASTAPPHLKAIFVGASEVDKYSFVRRGGITAQFNTRPDEPLTDDLASVAVDADSDGSLLKAAVAQHANNTPMAPLWYGMPYRDSVSPLTGNPFWEEVAVYRYLDAIRRAGTATYFWGNWHDEPAGQVILGAANTGAKFLGGPGDHCVPPPGFDFTGEVVRYFDHYLKGVDNGIERDPRATYWVEGLGGSGGYVRSAKLPGTDARPAPMYLGGGSLSPGISAAGTQRFKVDYKLPPVDSFAFWVKPMGAHGTSFAGAPLTAPLPLIGFPVAHLDVAVDKADANVFVYLEQVSPSGEADVIAFSRIKLSHRKLSMAPYDNLGLPWHSGRRADVTPVRPGQRVRIDLDLTPVSRIVPAGASLRFVVTGADPRQRDLKAQVVDPAPNISVFFGGKQGSRIDLPVAEAAIQQTGQKAR